MALAMNTERAKELQSSIQKELAMKGYSTESDPVMAEYITIMLINSKTPEQITSELTDLIGPEYDPKFTDWLFVEANASEEAEDSAELVSSNTAGDQAYGSVDASSSRQARVPPTGPRATVPLFQQAMSTISPPKRTRSSSPGPARKAPRISDLPDRPRAMRDDAPVPIPSQQPSGRTNGRSLLERVGPSPKYQHQNGSHQLTPQQYDPIQAQIDAVTGAAMGMNPNAPNFIPQQGANIGMPAPNPLAFQEMLGAQMALMAQMAMSMGIPPMGMMNGGGNGFSGSVPGNFQGAQMNGNGYGMGGRGRGRGGARGGSSRGGPPGHVNGVGRDQPSYASQSPTPTPQPPTSATNEVVVSPQPVPPPAAAQTVAAPTNRIHYPERPGTPTLCKFGMTCSNPVCRYSHPSPAATAESGLVLSNEPCEKGIKCEDKDCTKAHASPAILNPNAIVPTPTPSSVHHHQPTYKSASYHPYSKPHAPSTSGGSSTTACRFGAGCTRATCTFQHPPGRTTLPGEFHRGLRTSDPTVTLSPAQEKARMMSAATANRFNKTVTFNRPGAKAPSTALAVPPITTTSAAPNVVAGPSKDSIKKDVTNIVAETAT